MGAYEEQLKKIVNGPRWNADALLDVKHALEDVAEAFKDARDAPGWEGTSADAAVALFDSVVGESLKNTDVIAELVKRIDWANKAIDEAGRTLGDLPEGSIDPSVKAAVVGGASVVMPGFGTIASVGALAVAETFMAGGRDDAAKAALDTLQTTNNTLADDVKGYRSAIKIPDRGRAGKRKGKPDHLKHRPDPDPKGPTDPDVPDVDRTGPTVSQPPVRPPGTDTPPVVFTPPGIDTPPVIDTNTPPDVDDPDSPDVGILVPPGTHEEPPFCPPMRPSVDGGLDDGVVGGTGGGGGGTTGGLPGGSGSVGGSAGGGASLGGAGLLGAAGGGAAALAGAKAAGAAARGGAAFGGAGGGVLGGASGAGPATAASGTNAAGGASAAGARGGTGMMGGGGAGGGDDEEKERRGLGLFAPKLEDDETPEVSRAAGAGSRKPRA